MVECCAYTVSAYGVHAAAKLFSRKRHAWNQARAYIHTQRLINICPGIIIRSVGESVTRKSIIICIHTRNHDRTRKLISIRNQRNISFLLAKSPMVKRFAVLIRAHSTHVHSHTFGQVWVRLISVMKKRENSRYWQWISEESKSQNALVAPKEFRRQTCGTLCSFLEERVTRFSLSLCLLLISSLAPVKRYNGDMRAMSETIT